jgi:hypothetical protein
LGISSTSPPALSSDAARSDPHCQSDL